MTPTELKADIDYIAAALSTYDGTAAQSDVESSWSRILAAIEGQASPELAGAGKKLIDGLTDAVAHAKGEPVGARERVVHVPPAFPTDDQRQALQDRVADIVRREVGIRRQYDSVGRECDVLTHVDNAAYAIVTDLLIGPTRAEPLPNKLEDGSQ